MNICSQCGAPLNSDSIKCKYCGTDNIHLLSSEQAAKHKIKKSLKAKNKIIAGLLAIFLGTFGIHKFYLQNKSQGILYLLFFWTGIPTILGLIEGIRYLVMRDTVFYTNY